MRIEARDTYASGDIIGRPVRSPDALPLGRVEEIIIDVHRNALGYALLSLGTASGEQARVVPVPWPAMALKYEADEMYFVLDVEREVLEKAPGFDKNHRPDLSDPDWRVPIDKHFAEHVPRRPGRAAGTSETEAEPKPGESSGGVDPSHPATTRSDELPDY